MPAAFCRRISLLQFFALLLRTFENEMSVPNDKISKMLAVFKVKEFCVFVCVVVVVVVVWFCKKFIFINTSVCQMRLSYVKQAGADADNDVMN